MDVGWLLKLAAVLLLTFRHFVQKDLNLADLLGLPALAICITYLGLPVAMEWVTFFEFLTVMVLGAYIGYLQASKTKVKYQNEKISASGGLPYLIGWMILIVGRLMLMIMFHYHQFMEGFFPSKMMLFLYTDWMMWLMIASASVIYSLTLYLNFPEVNSFFNEQIK